MLERIRRLNQHYFTALIPGLDVEKAVTVKLCKYVKTIEIFQGK